MFLTGFVTNPAFESISSNDAHVGLALKYLSRPGVSVEVSATRQHGEKFVNVIDPVSGVGTLKLEPIHTYFFDVDVAYHFTNDSNWTPYVGAGLRYNSRALRHTNSQVNATSPEIVGGLVWQFARSFGIRVDIKQSLTPFFEDESHKESLGLQWKW